MSKMRTFLSCCLATVVCGLAANAFAAVTRTWTGGGDGVSWSDDANWDCMPTQYDDTARFTGSADVMLDRDWTNSAGAKCCINQIKVESGTVSITRAGSYYQLQMHGSPSIDVAEGATLVSSNNFHYFNYGWFTKKGKGTWRMLDSNFPGQHVWQVDIAAGKVESIRYASGSFQTTNLIVRSGAELSLKGQYLYDTCNLTLEEDATLRLDGGNAATVASLSGAGDVVSGPNVSTLIIKPSASSVRPPFTGTFSTNITFQVEPVGEGWQPFVVQRADQLKDVTVRSGAGLRFKSGIGLFDVGCVDGYVQGSFYLSDENDGPVTVRTSLVEDGTISFYGAGNLWVRNACKILQSKYHATGWVRADTGASLQIGSTSTANDFNLSGAGISGIYCDEGGGISIYNYGGCTRAAIPVVSYGKAAFAAGGTTPVGFDNIHFTATNKVNFSDGIDLGGGEFVTSTFAGNGGAGISSRNRRISGAKVYAPKTMLASTTPSVLPKPNGIDLSGANGWYTTVITAGELYRGAGGGHKEHHMFGGKTYFTHNAGMSVTDNAYKNGGNAKIVFDGGTAVLYNRADSQAFSFPEDNSRIDVFVSTNGGRIVVAPARDDQVRNYTITRQLTPTNGVDGGISFYGNGIFLLNHPMRLQGPVGLMDGGFTVNSVLYSDSAATPFGGGSLTLRNMYFSFSGVSASSTLNLATNETSELVLAGAASITFPAAGQSVATRAIRRAGPGSVLFLRLASGATLGDGTGSSMKCAVAPALQASGATKLPVIAGLSNQEGFVTYDAECGFQMLPEDATNDFTKGANSLVAVRNNITLSSDAAVGGINVNASWTSLKIDSGVTLTVGNGVDPAIILLGVVNNLTGTGTLDFGASEGIITASNSTGTDPSAIRPKISGSGGVSFVASPLRDQDYKVRLYNANNDYTGGTYVNVMSVRAAEPGCFSSGKVTVGGGDRAGGNVVLEKAATWANDFSLAGRGGRFTTSLSYLGALAFNASATVSGDVELREETRMSAANGMRGTISGVVSGDRLQIYNFPGTYGGTVALTGHNTYTGGTEVVAAAVAISESDGFGTGAVTIDGSVLEFANTSAISVPNKIEGVGTVRLTGGGTVTLTGDHSGFSAPLDLAGGDLTLAAMPDFVNGLTNSANSRCTLTVPAGGRLDFTGLAVGGLEKVDLVVAQGGQVDLGGETVTVRRCTGAADAVVNGTLVELKPALGLFLMVR